jgi:transcriptional regulator with XRE-family HTH domain
MISPYVRRLRLTSELRKLRTDAGLTTAQLAAKIGQSRQQISRLENGHEADLDDVMKILEVLGVEGDRWTEIVTVARQAAERGWWESKRGIGQRQAVYANLEAGATTIREYQQTFIPGLLQTADYARARNDAEAALQIKADPEQVLDGRAGRQRMLRRPGGPSYEVVLDEIVIRRPTAPDHVLRAQFEHIIAAVRGGPQFSVRILPVTARIENLTVPRCTYSLYTFDDPRDPMVVAIDTVTSDLVLTSPDEAAPYGELYRSLCNAALPEDDSLDLLATAAAKLPKE